MQRNRIGDARRNFPDSMADAKAAIRFAGSGVVGFDLAGPESGFPAEAHQDACRFAKQAGLRLTIHAGEAEGPESVAAALNSCGAERIGHGIRIVDDRDSVTGAWGHVAAAVHNDRIPLEVCPTSNLHTLAIEPHEHPLGALMRAGFNVTLSTDNRLMSNVTLTDEFALAVDHHGLGIDDLLQLSLNSADAAFTDAGTRQRLRTAVEAGYPSRSSSQVAT